jgi:citrate lyase subunit beta/citryl-CoA lyase
MQAAAREIRSKLFVPGSRPELFAKALAGDADALSFDLEDSVPVTKKDEARRAVSRFVQDVTVTHNKVMIVRVNPPGDPLFQADIDAVVVPGVHWINLPKVEAAHDVLAAVEAIEAAERSASIQTEMGVLANIETPRGLRCAYEIASAHPRVIGLQIGFVDLSRTCGFEGSNRQALNAVRFTVRLAAAEAGIAAFDGAFVDVRDQKGFRAEAEEARSLGLSGKSCIHPSQVAAANAVFSPSEEAIERAVRIVRAAEESGAGAFLLDGKMIDAPVLAQAKSLLARAAHRGLLSPKMEIQ